MLNTFLMRILHPALLGLMHVFHYFEPPVLWHTVVHAYTKKEASLVFRI